MSISRSFLYENQKLESAKTMSVGTSLCSGVPCVPSVQLIFSMLLFTGDSTLSSGLSVIMCGWLSHFLCMGLWCPSACWDRLQPLQTQTRIQTGDSSCETAEPTAKPACFPNSTVFGFHKLQSLLLRYWFSLMEVKLYLEWLILSM